MYAFEGHATNHYTVCYLFDGNLENVLLATKDRTDFKGLKNGVGGKIEPHENSYASALREIYEEAGLATDDLAAIGGARLVWTGSLFLPEDCREHDGRVCALHFYAGAVKAGSMDRIRPERPTQPLSWEPVEEILSAGVSAGSGKYAGHGDLQYMVGQGIAALRPYLA